MGKGSGGGTPIKFADTIQNFEPTRAQSYHQQAAATHDQEPFNKYIDPGYEKQLTEYTQKREGRKDDAGKNMLSLLPTDAIDELGKVFTLGAKKYSKHNYLNGMDWSRVQDALLRHYFAWAGGETNDPVDGQHHLASVAWCALALIMYQKHGLGKDDRWQAPSQSSS